MKVLGTSCFKNPENPSCIDQILTNNPCLFQNSWVIEIGLSDFPKMVMTVMKTTFEMLKPKSWNIDTIKSFAMICF